MKAGNTDAATGEALDSEAQITLGLLTAVHENSTTTQRSMASDLGIALGLANAYLKRCVKKGYVKVKQVPPNRYAYYLTPTGFSEKSRLTAEYLSSSLQFFRRARAQCAEALEACEARGWTRVALAGGGDLTEIAALCALDTGITVIGIIDPSGTSELAAGIPVVAGPEQLADLHAVVLTDFRQPQETYDRLTRHVAPRRIITPKMLPVIRDWSSRAAGIAASPEPHAAEPGTPTPDLQGTKGADLA